MMGLAGPSAVPPVPRAGVEATGVQAYTRSRHSTQVYRRGSAHSLREFVVGRAGPGQRLACDTCFAKGAWCAGPAVARRRCGDPFRGNRSSSASGHFSLVRRMPDPPPSGPGRPCRLRHVFAKFPDRVCFKVYHILSSSPEIRDRSFFADRESGPRSRNARCRRCERRYLDKPFTRSRTSVSASRGVSSPLRKALFSRTFFFSKSMSVMSASACRV